MARTRSERAREAALAAAQEVLADASVDGFTVEEVARRSGVAKTTIYRHWTNGNALLLEAMDCMVTPFPTPNTGSLDGDLRTFLGHVLAAVGDPGLTRNMLHVMAAAADDEAIAEIHRQMMAERMGPIRTILDLARARGEIRDDVDPDLLVDLVEGPFFIRKMVRREPIDADVIDQIVRVLVGALAPPAVPADAG